MIIFLSHNHKIDIFIFCLYSRILKNEIKIEKIINNKNSIYTIIFHYLHSNLKSYYTLKPHLNPL
jgi:hypothetical protein